MSTDAAMARLIVALLICCVVTSPADMTPVFDRAEAFRWVLSTDPKHIEVMGVLSTVIIALNPDLLPKQVIEEPKKKDRARRTRKRRRSSRASST